MKGPAGLLACALELLRADQLRHSATHMHLFRNMADRTCPSYLPHIDKLCQNERLGPIAKYQAFRS